MINAPISFLGGSMTESYFDKKEVLVRLNKILEMELAGVVRYTHYSFMVYGYNRIPIVAWLRDQANEALTHAQEAGEMITTLGEHPSLAMGPLLETHNHDIGALLRESLEIELQSLKNYKDLMTLVEGKNVMLEEYSRKMIYAEEMHASEVNKMLRSPGDVSVFKH
jgi:bacterioferritin